MPSNSIREQLEFAYLNNHNNKVIIRASPNYYGQKAFSDICIKMDESNQENYLTDDGLCYIKVLWYMSVWLINLIKLTLKIKIILKLKWISHAIIN